MRGDSRTRRPDVTALDGSLRVLAPTREITRRGNTSTGRFLRWTCPRRCADVIRVARCTSPGPVPDSPAFARTGRPAEVKIAVDAGEAALTSATSPSGSAGTRPWEMTFRRGRPELTRSAGKSLAPCATPPTGTS
ncbi:hypothetical protein GCM10020220_032960 [Nonomuraea rubra]|uniref:hypothetical protein n=1 Tax=Nonomuraea rubra TaxID=46180 RepID=UPI0031ED5D6F